MTDKEKWLIVEQIIRYLVPYEDFRIEERLDDCCYFYCNKWGNSLNALMNGRLHVDNSLLSIALEIINDKF